MNRYKNIPILKNQQGKNYYSTVKYPNIPLNDTDIYILCNSVDRYDKLAQAYYEDSSLWWIISIANNASPQDGLFPPLDTYIRIPSNYLEIKNDFDILNKGVIVEEITIPNNSSNISPPTSY
tara:strand:- start:203 stop:568 length:366 start_codon:yes stop_codon:yes gene_type:complete